MSTQTRPLRRQPPLQAARGGSSVHSDAAEAAARTSICKEFIDFLNERFFVAFDGLHEFCCKLFWRAHHVSAFHDADAATRATRGAILV